jgi:hypothetical protein
MMESLKIHSYRSFLLLSSSEYRHRMDSILNPGKLKVRINHVTTAARLSQLGPHQHFDGLVPGETSARKKFYEFMTHELKSSADIFCCELTSRVISTFALPENDTCTSPRKVSIDLPSWKFI